jgi:periplasmic iron binding protein
MAARLRLAALSAALLAAAPAFAAQEFYVGEPVVRAGMQIVPNYLIGIEMDRHPPGMAKDGPHYANNVEMAGPGTYRLTYTILPPSTHGFIRHIDAASGVPAWWAPITASWLFTYPSKTK